jgi:hypothetical protein
MENDTLFIRHNIKTYFETYNHLLPDGETMINSLLYQIT